MLMLISSGIVQLARPGPGAAVEPPPDWTPPEIGREQVGAGDCERAGPHGDVAGVERCAAASLSTDTQAASKAGGAAGGGGGLSKFSVGSSRLSRASSYIGT